MKVPVVTAIALIVISAGTLALSLAARGERTPPSLINFPGLSRLAAVTTPVRPSAPLAEPSHSHRQPSAATGATTASVASESSAPRSGGKPAPHPHPASSPTGPETAAPARTPASPQSSAAIAKHR